MAAYRSATCSKCWGLKLPIFGCQNETCSAYGAYRKRLPKLQSTRQLVAANNQKKQNERLAYVKIYNANFARRSKKQRHIHFRLLQIALGKLLNTIERGTAGNWLIYDDRDPEFQQAAKEASKLYSESIKYFPVPENMHNEYLKVLQFLRQQTS